MSTALVIGLSIGDSAARDQDDPPASAPSSRPAPVVDEDLVRKLLGGESSAVDAVQKTLERMGEATDLLKEKLDPGDKTQAVQMAILDGIDSLIEQARKGGSKSRSGKQERQARRTEGRRRPPRESRPKSTGERMPRAARKDAGQGPPGGDGRDAASRRRSERGELSRGWGFLPDRSRDEISQGFDEEFLSKYYEQIMRYYRRLANEGEDQ